MTSRRASWLLFLGCFGFFGFFARGYVENTDALITLQAARAWAARGDPGLLSAGQAELLAPGEPTWLAEHVVAGLISDPQRPSYGRIGVNGRHYVWFPIGHQALFVPCVVLGGWLSAWFPDPDRRFLDARGELLGDAYWSQFVASFLSPLAAAGTFMLLLSLARSRGASRRQALLIVAAATLCTQFWPGSSETLSNAPGTFFLTASALFVSRYVAGGVARRDLTLAGLLAGAAVLVRYPLVLAIAPLCVWAGVRAHRERALPELRWLALGGLPGLVLLLLANGLRFGNVFETGYTRSAGFGTFPIVYGLIAILLAPGKGVLWFSPPLWIGIAQAFRRECRGPAIAATLTALALPIVVFATVPYWGAGQCWGIRYLTGPLLLVLVVSFACGRPWIRRPRLFGGVCAVGFLVSLGGVLAPYTGQQKLAFDAARATYGDLPNLDNNVNFDLRFSPIHSHWTYAWLALTGRIDSGRSADTTEPLFGVETAEPVVVAVTDSGFRHWWWRSLGRFAPGFPAAIAALLWLIGTGAALVFALRSWLDEDRAAASPGASPS